MMKSASKYIRILSGVQTQIHKGEAVPLKQRRVLKELEGHGILIGVLAPRHVSEVETFFDVEYMEPDKSF